MKVTARKKTTFLQHLRDGMAVVHACGQINVSNVHMYRLRRRDPHFKLQWDEAIEEWEGTLLQRMEAEADRRSMEGVLEPVFYQGKTVGAVKKFSDPLLMFRMKKLNPAYRETPQIDVSQNVHLNGPPAARMTDDQHTTVVSMTVEDRRARLAAIRGGKD